MVFSDVIETCTPFLKDIAFLNFEILFKHGETKKTPPSGIFFGNVLKEDLIAELLWSKVMSSN